MGIADSVAKVHKLSPSQAHAAAWVRRKTLGFTVRDYRDAGITTGTMRSLERAGLVVVLSNHGREFPHSRTTYCAGPDLDSQSGGTRCCRCGQTWEGSAPTIQIGLGTPGQHAIEGCDQCGTDAHLVDFAPAG